jgi:DNA primase
MDRFRDRLIVPIVDRSGNHIIGLGGRILPRSQLSSQSSPFEPPKYLNSPESLVFKKGQTLFGEFVAREHLQRLGKNVSSVSRNIIIVEGYMDVLALWDVGVKQAVASMGTALSREQLSAAARVAQSVEGCVVLCLDNDAAGVAAVERLCSNGVLKEVSDAHKVAFRVATLPKNVKDPDEFIQSSSDVANPVGERFIYDVTGTADDWVSWFVNRIIACYNPGAQRGRTGSFSDIFQRVAEHLATAMGAADRTRTAYEVAGTLAGILALESNSTVVSEAVRSQLESDLIETSAKIATVRESVKRRTEAVSLGQSDPSVNALSVLQALTKGEGPSGVDDHFMSKTTPNPVSEQSSTEQDGFIRVPERQAKQRQQRRPSIRRVKSSAFKPRRLTETRATLTPHFSGFVFANKSDSDWLVDSSPSKVT